MAPGIRSALLALLLGASVLLIPEPSEQQRLDSLQADLQEQVLLAQEDLAQRTQELARRAAAANVDELWRAFSNEPGPAFVVLRQRAAALWKGHLPIADSVLAGRTDAHLRLGDGIYLHAQGVHDSTEVHGFLRLWYGPPFENRYLRHGFAMDFEVPAGFRAETTHGMGPVVRDAHGEVMFRLAVDDDRGNAPVPWRAWLLLAAALAAVHAWWCVCMAVRPHLRAVLAFALPLVALRGASMWVGPWELLATIPVFDPSYFGASTWIPSLGDLAIDALLFLAITAFLRQRMMVATSTPAMTWTWAVVGVAVLFLLERMIVRVIIALVRDSRVTLDLFHIQGFTGFSWTAIGCIVLLAIGWLAAADAWLRRSGTTLTSPRCVLLCIAATLLQLGIDHLQGIHDTMLALWPLATLLALCVMHRPRTHFGGAVLLVAVQALFIAHILDRETLKGMANERAVLAEANATREDPVVEVLFQEATEALQQQDAIAALPGITGHEGTRNGCVASDLDRLIRQEFFTGYWDRYHVRLHVFDTTGRALCSTSPEAPPAWDQVRSRFQQGVPTAGDTALRSVHRPGEEALYIGLIDAPAGRSFLRLAVELRPRLLLEGPGFPALLLAGELVPERRLERYVSARYERGALTESAGAYPFPIHWREPVPPEGMQLVDGGYDLLLSGDVRSTLVALGHRLPTWLDHFTAFSYLFTLFALLGGALALVHFALGRNTRQSLAGNLRTGILLLSTASLVLFAFGMRSALNTRSEQRASRAARDRGQGVLTELRRTVGAESRLDNTMVRYLDHLLVQAADVFSVDVSLYSPEGHLLATSREQVFNTGLLDRRMDAEAFRQLAILGRSSFVQHESIGEARFRASYLPFRNERGDVLAYVAMPYFARQTETDQERSAGEVAVVNLFTVLFVLSGIAAALITQWTVRPLFLLRAGLERIGLGQRNEPIAYSGNDELGDLVRVYNRKVEELRESADKLARSERESAWKEMARQVAHEIKNPLTPMKLNIQHFQQTWDPAAPNARERLDRFSNNLVEQIDVLSRIAGEFSHFAQMPPAHPVALDLPEVADAAVQLFANTPGCTVHLEAAGPLPVLADREHLLRTFNNLIKNAQQAMADDRAGDVRVLLRREGNEAIIEVRDNGTGIPADAVDHVFVPRFTTKSSGMGLGLPMVKRMVENAGGRVWFTTEEGKGTSFFVGLPLVKGIDP